MEIISSLEVNAPLIYRRATIISAAEHQVSAEMEDDFHHFKIMLRHDGDVVTEVVAQSIRYPWSTCGDESAKKLQELTGCRLDSLYKQLPPEARFAQCTHLFDLVQLAISHAGKPGSTQLYENTVTVIPSKGVVRAELKSNRECLLCWDIEDGSITGPEPYRGQKIDKLRTLAMQQPPELAEAILVLQRAIHVSVGKIFDWSPLKKAAEMQLPPTCYTFQTATAARSDRVPGNIRDFTHSAEQMLGGKVAR